MAAAPVPAGPARAGRHAAALGDPAAQPVPSAHAIGTSLFDGRWRGALRRAVRGVTLAGERWDGEGAPVVLLHAGVADRRAWRAVAPQLAAPAIAYDRRGFGDTPPTPPPSRTWRT